MKGPKDEIGPLPAFIYFALNGKDTLNLDPYNQPIQALEGSNIRAFSWDLPFHQEGKDPATSLKNWSDAFEKGEDFITPFIEESVKTIQNLIDQGLILKDKICVGGLSRGGFMAMHLAKRLPFIKHVLGFAPLTNLHSFQGETHFPDSIFKDLNVIEHTDGFIHKKIRLYMGNYDERVNTDYAYEFIRSLTKRAHEKKMRHYDYELYITPSIGHKGHGTAKETFFQGAAWVSKEMLN